jgi:hypothetical protein
MKVADFLNLTDAAVDVVVTDKQELLEELAVRAAARVGLRPERILSELVKRERAGNQRYVAALRTSDAHFEALKETR